MKALEFLVFTVFGFFAGVLQYGLSFFMEIPNVPEPTIDKVTLDKKNIELMQPIDVPNVLVIGR